MTDHCYWMGCLNENIGYNQPTHTGYYLGSDLKNDADAWAEAEKVQNKGIMTGIRSLTPILSPNGEGSIYTLSGVRIQKPQRGLYIKNGKKTYIK
jgi:rhamnogalacturonan endolyase